MITVELNIQRYMLNLILNLIFLSESLHLYLYRTPIITASVTLSLACDTWFLTILIYDSQSPSETSGTYDTLSIALGFQSSSHLTSVL